MIAQSELKELLRYDPSTGNFTWSVSRGNGIKIGDVAGTLDTHGYSQIKIRGKLYLAHRLAWLYMTGVWPKDQIDHINHVRDDNRWINLAEATNQSNQKNCSKYKNNTSGRCGVCWSKQNKKWQAGIKVNGKLIHLGFFANKLEAAETRKSAEIKYGFHPNHGR